MTPMRALCAAIPAGLLLAACGHSAPTTLHTLVATPATATYAAYAGPPVRVALVQLPPSLDRIELLRPTGAGAYRVAEFDRWTALPSRLARQTLAGDLSIRLPAGAVLGPPGDDPTPTTTVAVTVFSYTPGPSIAALSASWARGCAGDAPRRAYVRLETPSEGDSPAALAALIGRLADRIAADLAADPYGACTTSPPPATPH